MIGINAALAAFILASGASAQVRIGAVSVNAVGGNAVAGAVGARESMRFTSPVGSLPSASSLSPLSSPLPAPSVRSFDILPPKAGLSPAAAAAVPAALIPAAVPLAAASKADDIKAEAAKAVADWRASQARRNGAAKAPAAPAPAVSPDELDALFDGTVPASRVVLSRAAARGLRPAALGLAVAESKTPDEAAARLVSLRVLGSREAELASLDQDALRFLLLRVWNAAEPEIPAEFPTDKSWGIDALKVERGGTTYFVHGVAHGRHVPPRRGAVLALAARLEKAGRALYSEQNLPAFYGYVFGRETLDHALSAAGSAEVADAAPGWSYAGLKIKNALDRALAPGGAIAAAAWAALQPGSAWPWLALAAALVFSFLMMTSGIVVNRWRHRRRAALNRREGWEDIAAQYEDEARHYFTAKPDLAALRGLELPQPLGAAADRASLRSRAIADAVAADAAAAGATAVHLVVGHLHAHEVAWRLKHGPRTAGSGSQIS